MAPKRGRRVKKKEKKHFKKKKKKRFSQIEPPNIALLALARELGEKPDVLVDLIRSWGIRGCFGAGISGRLAQRVRSHQRSPQRSPPPPPARNNPSPPARQPGIRRGP